MQHTSRDGASKLLKECTLPITGLQCVTKVVSNLGVFDIEAEGFVLRERAPGISVSEIIEATDGRLVVPDEVPEMQF